MTLSRPIQLTALSVMAASLGETFIPLSCAFAQSAPQPTFSVRPQPLADALRELARQAGMEVLFSAEAVEGRIAPALEGSYPIEEAVRLLLSGSGLTVLIRNNAILVRRSVGASTGDTLDAGGPDVVVTGSNIRGALPTSPVIVLDRRAITDAGQATIGDALRSLPQNFSGGQNPGVAFGSNTTNPTNGNLNSGTAINLRGLGPDATLTLVNGHRLAYDGFYQAIDASVIPLPALDRIEILADGASAVYGSDAVAGVANIILRKDYDGFSALARLGKATLGGNYQQQYGAVTGTTWASGGLIATYNFARDTRIDVSDRSYTRQVLGPQSLLPAQKSHSAVFSIHDQPADAFSLSLDAVFNQRRTNSEVSLPSVTGAIESRSTNFAIVPTLSGRLGAWTIAATGTYAHSKVLSLIDYRQRATGAFAFSDNGRYDNELIAGEISGEGRVLSLPGGDARAAVGIGYRENRFASGSGLGGARDSTYTYGEVSLPLLSASQAVPLVERLLLTAALRHERYDALGEVTTPKIGILYSPAVGLDVKASWGKSFKAPTFLQLFSTQDAYLYRATSVGGSGYPAASTALLAYGGNPDLKPERATTWSGTVTLQPRALSGFRAEVSLFRINYVDRVVEPVDYTSALGNPIYSEFVTLTPTASQQQAVIDRAARGLQNFTGRPYDPSTVVAIINDYYLNVAAQTVRGVDVSAQYRTGLLGGEASLQAAASWIKSRQKTTAAGGSRPLAGTVFNPPNFRLRSTAGFDRGAVGATLVLNHLSGVDDIRVPPAVRGSGMTTIDVALRAKLDRVPGAKQIEIALAAQNLLNTRPPFLRSLAEYYVPYDSTNYSAIGRFVSVTVTSHW